MRPFEVGTRHQSRAADIDPRVHSVTVVFDLMKPVANPTGDRMSTDRLFTARGKAVLASWGELPVEVQQALFEVGSPRA
jgi:hypothetical protein